jgi:uncharacterized protein (DUF1499 family)
LHAFQRFAAPRLVEVEGTGKAQAEDPPPETRHLPMGEFVHGGIIPRCGRPSDSSRKSPLAARRKACCNITMRTLLLSLLLLLPGIFFFASAAGAGDADLPPCPSSPNCVSSRDPDPSRRVDPIPFAGTAVEAREGIETVVRSFPRAVVVDSSGIGIRAEFRSLLGFVDDVEFRIDEAAGVIHVRSASRTGYWDFGVNRRRVEEIREVFGNVLMTRKDGAPGNR